MYPIASITRMYYIANIMPNSIIPISTILAIYRAIGFMVPVLRMFT